MGIWRWDGRESGHWEVRCFLFSFPAACGSERRKVSMAVNAMRKVVEKVLAVLRNTDQPVGDYIWKAWLIALLPSIAISAIVALVVPGHGPSFNGPLWFVVVGGLILSPWVETLLMWRIFRMLKYLTKRTLWLACGSAFVWALLHSTSALTWGLTVFWGFVVLSVCFLEWEKQSTWMAIKVTAAIHTCINMIPVVFVMIGCVYCEVESPKELDAVLSSPEEVQGTTVVSPKRDATPPASQLPAQSSTSGRKIGPRK
jgi:hypothetical protein